MLVQFFDAGRVFSREPPKPGRNVRTVVALHGTLVRTVTVSCSRLGRTCLSGTIHLLLCPLYEPGTLPDRHGHGLTVGEAHVVHEEEGLLEEDLLIIRRQAKKSWRPWEGAPPRTRCSAGTPSRPSSRCRARCDPCACGEPASRQPACCGQTPGPYSGP